MSNKQVDTIFGTPIGLITILENTDILQTYKGQWNQNPNDIKSSWISEDIRVLESYPQIKKSLLRLFYFVFFRCFRFKMRFCNKHIMDD